MNTSGLSTLCLLVTKRTLFLKHKFLANTQRVGVTAETGATGPQVCLHAMPPAVFPSLRLSSRLRKWGMSLEAPSWQNSPGLTVDFYGKG